MNSFDLSPRLRILIRMIIAQAQKLFEQVLLKVCQQLVQPIDRLFLERPAIEPDDPKVIPVLDLLLDLPVCVLQLFVLILIRLVCDLRLVDHFEEVIFLHRLRVLIRQHCIEVILLILHLHVHLVLEKHALQVKNQVLKLVADEFDERAQVYQLTVHLLHYVVHYVLDLLAITVHRVL